MEGDISNLESNYGVDLHCHTAMSYDGVDTEVKNARCAEGAPGVSCEVQALCMRDEAR